MLRRTSVKKQIVASLKNLPILDAGSIAFGNFGRRCLVNVTRRGKIVLGRPGNYLLSQVLRHSTIGAGAFDGRVRDGIGSDRSAEGHQAGETQY